MSDPNNERHPSTLSDDEKATMRASDPAAFEDDDTGSAPEVEEPAKTDPPPADSADPVDPPAGEGAPAPATDKPPPMVPKARLNEVIDQRNAAEELSRQQALELAQLRERIASTKAPKDFESEFRALDDKAEADRAELESGAIDDEEYARREADRRKQERTLTREEARHSARLEAMETQQEALSAATTRSWEEEVKAWSDANPGFLAGEGNSAVFQRAVNAAAALHGDQISNAELLTHASKMAFEVTGYQPPAGTETPAQSAGAPRRAQNAQRAAEASAAPPAISGGVGGRGGPERGVDIANLKPGEFSKLSKADQERALGEGAL